MPSIPTSIVDVYRTHDVYADFAQEHRQAGSVPVEFIRVAQGPFEATDPATHSFFLGVSLTSYCSSLEVDFGEGRRHLEQTAHAAYLNPTLVDTDFVMGSHFDLVLLAVPLSGLATMLGMEVAALNTALCLLHDRMVHDPLVRHLALAMWGAVSTGETQASLYVDQALMTLALHLTLLGRGADWPIGAESGGTLGAALHGAPGRLGPQRLARVLDRIEADIAAPLTVADLAAVACLSPYHFSRSFRAATGQTPHRYVMGCRLGRARERLLAGHEDVASVALATGFASHAHLSTSVKARFGVAPSAYRRLQ